MCGYRDCVEKSSTLYCYINANIVYETYTTKFKATAEGTATTSRAFRAMGAAGFEPATSRV